MKRSRPLFGFVALILAVAALLFQFHTAAAGPSAIYTVNSNADTDDTVCDATNCTLREAINAANANSNADTIEFALGSGTPTIAVGTAGLPTITQPVTINGNTGGATRVELNGTGTSSGVDGLRITGGNATIRNLVINRFAGDGIEINTNGSNVVVGCIVGLDATGATYLENGDTGIYILNSSNNTVGGTTAAARNLITSDDAIFIESTGTTTTGNVVQGNYIGLDVTGMLARGGSGGGVSIYDADGNTIGGTAAGAGNVIADFSGLGIELFRADNNFIQGNIIGLAADGTTVRENGDSGIALTDSNGNTIGGTNHTAGVCDGACNVISGNDSDGIDLFGFQANSNNNTIQGNFIGTDKSGTAARGNGEDGMWLLGGTGNLIGGTSNLARNVISGNGLVGIRVNSGGSGNTVQGNYIGTNAAGTLALGNSESGMYLSQAQNTTVGGTDPGAGNVISGNDTVGVDLFRANGNTIQGNIIGLGADGNTILGNEAEGMQLTSSSNNVIGGTNHTPGACDGACNVISGNKEQGIGVYFGGTPRGDNNLIQGNYIGTDKTGLLDRGNSFDGVFVGGATNTTIGGTVAGAGNLISGNDDNGVRLSASVTTGNLVQGNLIGTDKNGTGDLGNSNNGVRISSFADFFPTDNTIGGTSAGARNIISGNDANGIYIAGTSTTRNIVQGNYIGLQSNGTAVRPNRFDGIFIENAPGNTIGGTASGAGNIISGNSLTGIRIGGASATGNQIQGNSIGTSANGNADLGNTFSGVYIYQGSNNTVGGTSTGAGNVISGNGSSGVYMDTGASGNQVQGNFIGTNAAGTTELGNSFNGVFIGDAPNNTVGGLTSAARNVISGNDTNGIELFGNAAVQNLVQGNYLGTNAAGTGALPNTFAGVYINGGDNNTIGGTASAARNVISGNNGDGIDIQSTATGNKVEGNYIGANASGAGNLGNAFDGIYIDSASNTIGGTDANARNVISGNNRNGIQIDGAAAAGNQVIGNYIGTNASGTGDLGNTFEGVFVDNAPNNTIGGTTPAHRNVISGNDDAGVDIYQSGATGNVVLGNYIGTQANGTSALGNGFVGVWIEGSAGNNTIGGTTSGAGNVIAFNAADGVFVETGTGNQIRRNSIFSNGGLGIDLGANGVTANDAGSPPDADTGANNLQNFPALTGAQQGSTIVAGSFTSTPNTSFTLEFFSSTAADETSNGEGQTFLCDGIVTTDGSGAAAVNVTCPTTAAAGSRITATATRNAAPFDTSEFSNAVALVSAPTAVLVSEFSGAAREGRVELRWTTANELTLTGFNLWRRAKRGEELQLNAELIPAQQPGALSGLEYRFTDANVTAGKKYTYRLEPVTTNGADERVEPIQVRALNAVDACAAKPKRVQLLSPRKREIVQERRVTLDWKDAACAASYTLIVRQGKAKGTLVARAENLTVSELVTERLKRGETYYWTVRACNAAGCGKVRRGSFVVGP